MHRTEEEALTETQEYMMYPPQEPAAKPLKATVKEEDHNLVMEVDTGASVTVVSEATLGRIWVVQPVPPLQPTTARLRTYTGEKIPVIRKLTVKVRYQGQEEELPLLVVAGDGHSLLGRDWLAKLKLDWKNIFHMHTQETLEDVLERPEAGFCPGLGEIKGV